MKITIEHHDDQFNLQLSSREGEDPFLTIFGCRVKDGSKGRFISWPARKNESTGKWWNHVRSSDKFTEAVLKEYDAAAPKSRPAPKKQDDDDVPW